MDIRSAETRAVKVSITGELELESCGTTTDGRRMFASCWNVTSKKKRPSGVYALDVISRQWSRFAPLPPLMGGDCMEWYAGRLYVAGGFDDRTRRSFCVYLSLIHI